MDKKTKKLFGEFNKTYSSLSKQTKGLSLRQHEDIITEVMNTFTLFALQRNDLDKKKELLLMITHCQKYFNLVKKGMLHKYMKKLFSHYQSKKSKKGGYKIIQNLTNQKIKYTDDDYTPKDYESVIYEEPDSEIPEGRLNNIYKDCVLGGGMLTQMPEIQTIRRHLEEVTFQIECEVIGSEPHPSLLARESSTDSVDSRVDTRELSLELGRAELNMVELVPKKTGDDLEGYIDSFERFMYELHVEIRDRGDVGDVPVLKREASTDSFQTTDIEHLKEQMILATEREIRLQRFKRMVRDMFNKNQSEELHRGRSKLTEQRNAGERFQSMAMALSKKVQRDRLRRALDELTEERRYHHEIESAISQIPRLTEQERRILETKSSISVLEHVGIFARASCFGFLSGFYQTPSDVLPIHSGVLSEQDYEQRFNVAVEAAKIAAAPKERAALLDSFEKKLGFKDILHITNTVIEVKKDNTFIEKDASVKIPFSSGTLKKVGESLPLVTVDTYADAVTKTISELAEKNFNELRAKALENAKKGLQVAASKSELVNDIATGKLSLSLEQPHIRAKLKDMLKDVETPVLWREEPVIEEIIQQRLEEIQSVEGFDSIGDLPNYLITKIENFKKGITTIGSDTFNYAVGSCCCSLIGEYAVKCNEMIDARQDIKNADADYETFLKIVRELEENAESTEEITAVMRSLSPLPHRQRRQTSSVCIDTGALFSAGGGAAAAASSLYYVGGLVALPTIGGVSSIFSAAYIAYLAHKRLQLNGDVTDNLAITKYNENKKSKGGRKRKQTKKRAKRNHRRTARKN